MTQPQNLESLLLNGDIGEACRRLAAPLRSVLSDRAGQMRLPAHLVEDALQEAFLRLLLYHGRFDPARGSAWTWVQTVAVRALIDLARRLRPGRPLYGPDGKPAIDPVCPGAAADPGDAAGVVEAALTTMNPRHREAVRLRLAGVDQKTVGTTLGLRPGNVGVIYHHFRAKVRALVAG